MPAAAMMVSAMAAMALTVVITAVALVPLAVMMVSSRSGSKLKRTGQIGLYCLIGAAAYAALKLDTRLGQRLLRPRPDAAADQRMDALAGQQARQRAMAAFTRREDAAGNDLLRLYLIKLEGLRMAKMLKDLSVIVGYCNDHLNPSLLTARWMPVA